MDCLICNKKLSGLQKKFCSTKCKNKSHQSYSSQKERSLERKLSFVKDKGGECSQCGYKKNLAALCFHHLSNKNFKLDARNLSNRTIKSLKEELDKCILLCSNCHQEIHNPNLDFKNFKPGALTN